MLFILLSQNQVNFLSIKIPLVQSQIKLSQTNKINTSKAITMSQIKKQLAILKQNPVTNLNTLNEIIPALMEAYSESTGSKEVHKVLEAVVELRDTLKQADLLTQKESVAIASDSAQAITGTAQKFIVERLKVLLGIMAAGADPKSLMQVFDMLMLFVQDALEGMEPEEQLKALMTCQLVKQMFKPVVLDSRMYQSIYSEVLQPNLDSCLVMLTVIREEFAQLKTKQVYDMLVSLPKLDAEEMELMFIQDEEEEENEELEEEEADEKPKVSKTRQDVFKATQSAYEQAWLLVLAQISDKGKKMIKKTLQDMPQKIMPNFGNPLLLADFLMACLDDQSDIQIQVLALKGLFLLLQKHGLDCPKYYDKLYALLLPQRIELDYCGGLKNHTIHYIFYHKKQKIRQIDRDMVRPMNYGEQQRLTPFIQDHTLLILVSTQSFDKVSKRTATGAYSQVLPDLPHAKQECQEILQALSLYGVRSKQNIYSLTNDPSHAQFMKELRLITNRLEAGMRQSPRVNYLVIWVFSGHGVVKDGVQNLVLNQFDPDTKFYRLLVAESIVRDLAQRFSNSYMLAIFSSCRQIFNEVSMSEMVSTQETELREGSMVGMGDVGILVEEIEDDEVDEVIQRENLEATRMSLQDLQLSEQVSGAGRYILLFGSEVLDKVGDQSITLTKDIARCFRSNFNRSTLTLQMPDAFDTVRDTRPDFQAVMSKSLQPVNLTYSNNKVIRSIAYIFVNTKVHNAGHPLIYTNASQIGERAMKLFQTMLRFKNVQLFTNLCKEEVIEKLQELKAYAGKTSQTTQVAIVWIGHTLFSHDTPHNEILSQLGVQCPDDALDGTLYQHDHQLTCKGEPICLNEYAADIATAKTSHVMLIVDFQIELSMKLKKLNIREESGFHEMVQDERPGRQRLTYIFKHTVQELYEYFQAQLDGQKKRIFFMPQDFVDGGIHHHNWPSVETIEQSFFDLRGDTERQAIKSGGPALTFKRECEMWQERPKIIASRTVAQASWQSTVVQLIHHDQIVTITSGENPSQAECFFYIRKPPHELVNTQLIQKDFYDNVVVAHDRRPIQVQSAFYAVLYSTLRSFQPCKLIKFTSDERGQWQHEELTISFNSIERLLKNTFIKSIP